MSSYPSIDIERAARESERTSRCVTNKSVADECVANESAASKCAINGRASNASFPRARIERILPESPADDAGFEPGCYICAVDGQPVRDLIDWRWLSCEDDITVLYIDLDGDTGEVELFRDPGADWGFEFDGVIFDGVKQCRNACTFCFMRQLPGGMRPSLSLRDDDFRLSFLSGTFVTFTNLTAADEARIIEQHISPLRMSLHATDADVRARLIGKHAPHGLEVLERLCAAGIEFHTQIVLVPGENDGEVLARTLEWAYAHPGIVNVGIVPLGFTKHQGGFNESFNDPQAARAVLSLIEPFQKRALAERATSWVFAADEFYRNAFGEQLLENLPPTSHYGDFSLFEDGIGIIRSYVDDWRLAHENGSADACVQTLRRAGVRVCYVVGGAMQPQLGRLLSRSPLQEVFSPLVVQNDFFGGNVDVTGLLCGCDIVRALRTCACDDIICIPNVIFNDDGLTLDDMSADDMSSALDRPLHVVSCNPSDFLPEISALVAALS